MKTFKIISIALLFFTVLTTNAQVGTTHTTKGDGFQKEDTVGSFRQLSSDIAFNADFDYRRELKKSRSERTVFYFKDTAIAKTKLLKHLKRAARNSDNSIQFQSYFLKKQLHFIHELDGKTLFGVYNAMRSKTLNGYLDILSMFALSDRMLLTQ